MILCDELKKISELAECISKKTNNKDVKKMANQIDMIAFRCSTLGTHMENRMAYYRLAIEMLGFTRDHEETLDYGAPPLMSAIVYDLKTRFFNGGAAEAAKEKSE